MKRSLLFGIVCVCICAPIAPRTLRAATVTWTGLGTDANASTGGNWNSGIAPASGDDVVIDSTGKAIVWDGAATPAVHSLQMNMGFTGMVSLTGPFSTAQGLTVNAGILATATGASSTLTVGGNLSIGATGRVLVRPSSLLGSGAGQVLNVARSVNILTGGALSADQQGFGANAGPGAGLLSGTNGSGGGYGGAGASNASVAGGASYGVTLNPAALGSGGGAVFNPIREGGFENPNVGPAGAFGSFTATPVGSAWMFTSGPGAQDQAGISANQSGYTGSFGIPNPNAPEGVQCAYIQGLGSINQVVALAAGTYAVTCQTAQRSNTQTTYQIIRVSVDGQPLGDFQPNAMGKYEFQSSNVFTVTAGNHTVRFDGLNPKGGDNTALLDDVQIRPIANVIAENGFENPNVGPAGNFTSFSISPVGSAWTFAPSTVAGDAGISANLSGYTGTPYFPYNTTINNPNAPEGQQVALVQGTGSFSQAVTVPSGTYALTYRTAQRVNFQTTGQILRVTIDGLEVGDYQPGLNSVYQPEEAGLYDTAITNAFTLSAGTHTIQFTGLNPLGGDHTAFVDNVLLEIISGPSCGGGAITLNAGGAVTVNGALTAEGGTGIDASGGGSGGSISIVAPAIGGTGTISAKGGDGDVGQGGGGGGRISIQAPAVVAPAPLAFAFTFSGSVSVAAGANGTVGAGNGSVFIPPAVSSVSNQAFNAGDPSTLIQALTITNRAQATLGAVITAGNGIRIRIPATFKMTWDPAKTTAILGGSAAAKVSNTVSYSGGNRTLALNVLADFNPGDSLTLSGLAFANFFLGGVPNVDNLEVDILNTGAAQVEDTRTITINKAILQVLATSVSSNYGSPIPPLAYTFSGFVNGDTAATVSGAPTLSTAASPFIHAGVFPIVVSIGTLSSANYTFVLVNGTATVNKLVLTVTANPASQVFGAAPTPFSYTLSGFVPGESAADISGAPAFSTTAKVSSPIGVYPLLIMTGTLAATNYTFNFIAGTLTVVSGAPVFGSVMLTPNPAQLNQAVSGSTSVTASGGATTTITWDFGDGTSATGSSVQHTWQTAGLFTITITAVNNDGTTSSTQSTMFISLSAGALPPDATGAIVVGGAGASSKLGKASMKVDFNNSGRTMISGTVGLVNFPAALKQADLVGPPGLLTLGQGTLAQTFLFFLNKSGSGKATQLPKIMVSLKKRAVSFTAIGRPGLITLAEALGATPQTSGKSTLPLSLPATLTVGNTVSLSITFKLIYHAVKNKGIAATAK